MTLLVSWAGVDTHGTTSAYIVSDSRISWGSRAIFDHGRKVFALRHFPDILGYCGDVLFPSMVLSQVTEMADQGLLFPPNASSKERFESIKEKLVKQFIKYPSMVKGITNDLLQVIHISRDMVDNLKFECRVIEWSRKNGWAGKDEPMPDKSEVLYILGTGSGEFKKNYKRYNTGENSGTSRNVFQCFCDTLSHIKDRNCGGAPQLVGLYRIPNSSAITFGIIKENMRYFLGAKIDDCVDFTKIAWRNDLFELCDGQTKKRIESAQSQPDSSRRS